MPLNARAEKAKVFPRHGANVSEQDGRAWAAEMFCLHVSPHRVEQPMMAMPATAQECSEPKCPSVRKIGCEIGVKSILRFDCLPVLDGRCHFCESPPVRMNVIVVP